MENSCKTGKQEIDNTDGTYVSYLRHSSPFRTSNDIQSFRKIGITI